jgi:hypothetical protein
MQKLCAFCHISYHLHLKCIGISTYKNVFEIQNSQPANTQLFQVGLCGISIFIDGEGIYYLLKMSIVQIYHLGITQGMFSGTRHFHGTVNEHQMLNLPVGTAVVMAL